MEVMEKEVDVENYASSFADEVSFEPDSDSNVSDFEEKESKHSNLYTAFVISDDERENKKKQLRSLKALVEKRKTYLDKLGTLDNWISGQSDSPSRQTIECSKNVLEVFKNWLFANEYIPVPKIIMGPIPTGGVTIEFRPDSQNGMFISFHNDDTLEVDIMVEEAYHSVDIEQFKASPYILEAYEYMVND